MADSNLVQQMFASLNNLIDYKMSQQSTIKSAIVNSVNSDGTVNIIIPPETRIYHNIQNQSIYQNLKHGDGVKIIVENGNLSSMWIIGGFNLSVDSRVGSDKKLFNVDDIYPVGSIYLSMDKKSPNILFGGTWKQLKDRFLLGAGGNYTAGETDGEATHMLTPEEMPTHSHSIKQYTTNTSGIVGATKAIASDSVVDANYTWRASAVAPSGDGVAHNNMPPYLAVYMWQRIQ